MSDSTTDRTLALAGLFQAAAQVQHLAREGTSDPDMLETAVASIFNTKPSSTEAVFGGRDRLKAGLHLIGEITNRRSAPPLREITQYVVTLLALERQLAKRPAMLDQIGDGIERARGQAEHFSASHAYVLSNLSGVYSETISTLMPKILVHGSQSYLTNPEIATRIRVFLLAGIRAAVLWRQRGGSHWQLLFGRGAIARTAQNMLSQMEA